MRGRSTFPAEAGASTWGVLAVPEPVTDEGLTRQWRGFMTARIVVAAVLLLLLAYTSLVGQLMLDWTSLVCMGYALLTIAMRLWGKPKKSSSGFDPQWLLTVGVDVLVFSSLLYLQMSGVNFTPLFALPVMMAAVLGSLLLALGTAAIVTLVLLSDAWWLSVSGWGDATPRYLQAALTGSGLFILAYLANQLAARLARQEKLVRISTMVARAQIEVNQLVIDTLTDGVLVVDMHGIVRAANPAARVQLGMGEIPTNTSAQPFMLASDPAWNGLLDLANTVFSNRREKSADVILTMAEQGVHRLHVRAKLAAAHSFSENRSDQLCVLFLEDLREMEARLRTEKLVSMGRMSAAVAHEIRNPLSAISQANALLAEELHVPAQLQLTQMVQQNAQRLARIVDDILEVSRASPMEKSRELLTCVEKITRQICDEWSTHHASGKRLFVAPMLSANAVIFEHEHLRRILVNLLDNAARYASHDEQAMQVSLEAVLNPHKLGLAMRLMVWSDGTPLEQGVERHLFEPFFSSESRSSGLGLYICRELCERHGASIGYQRQPRRMVGEGERMGNEFSVLMLLST